MYRLNEKPNTIDWTGKTILIADDIHINFLLLEAIMEKTNVKLIWAKNGQEAVEKCHAHEFIDLILMDIEMPVMNGIQAAREIKKFRESIPIIAQTAFAAYFDENEILQAGCSQVISKPLMSEYILNTVARYL